MSFSPYGDPNAGKVATRPACWGSRYESESRECKSCGWQASCREQIIQLNINRQTAAPQSTVSPATQALAQFPSFAPAPYATPAPFPATVSTWQPPTPPSQFPPPTPVPVQHFRPPPPPPPVAPSQQARPMASYIPPPMPGGYGSIGDPMFNVIGASPAPIRPQYEGESFVGRVAKNSILSGIEAVLGQWMLGVRQFRWYPTPPDTQTPVVDVSPKPPAP